MISGVVTKKMLPRLIRIYEQMPDPKYVICFGQCPTSGGAFWDSYSMVFDIEKYVPVDVFVPACPPKPEDLVRGFMLLEEKIKNHETEWDKSHRTSSK
jgi:NADH-quinone oxidoreductase subunit B